uniref:Uncharacterized protein n=1 Tax=uncultured marine virus TaxID=186617 RepID=A0A0F7L438_9VIRU|nr:hypothetical protein [uncultured marine virus]
MALHATFEQHPFCSKELLFYTVALTNTPMKSCLVRVSISHDWIVSMFFLFAASLALSVSAIVLAFKASHLISSKYG